MHFSCLYVQFIAAEESGDKIKLLEDEPKVKEKGSPEISADSSKENQKTSALPKTDYIHVRARRGQATDSHSLAERVSRRIFHHIIHTSYI